MLATEICGIWQNLPRKSGGSTHCVLPCRLCLMQSKLNVCMCVCVCVCVCRMSDADVINIDSDDSDDDDVAAAVNGRASHSSLKCPPVAWDLSRAALQLEQMIEPRYRTSHLGNYIFSLQISVLSGVFHHLTVTKAPFIATRHRVELSCVIEVYKATQLNSTQLNCQLSICRRRVGGSERRDPVEVVCGS